MKIVTGIRPSLAGFVLIAGIAYMGAVWAAGGPDSGPGAARAGRTDLSEIRDRAERMPIDRRNDIEKRIRATVERVNNEAAARGQTAVAARLASAFAVTSEALLGEKAEHGLSWGEMVVAHTLLAKSGGRVTLLDLMTLRAEGLAWGAIAFGLRFHMEDFEDTIKAKGRIAMGLSKADGKAVVTEK